VSEVIRKENTVSSLFLTSVNKAVISYNCLLLTSPWMVVPFAQRSW